jgi:hypothetical protein
MAKTRTTVAIENETLEAIKEEAKEEGITQSDWIRDAIELKLESEHGTLEDLQARIEELEEWQGIFRYTLKQNYLVGDLNTWAHEYRNPEHRRENKR